MKVYLRWSKSSRCAFPFVFDVSEETTVSEICKLVMQQNNSNDNNPTFYNVKLRANDNTFINESLLISSFPRVHGFYYFDFDAEI
jgi:hypothetical protein